MIRIADISGRFLSKEVYKIYAPCMYQPTWEKFCTKAEKYLQNGHAVLLGAVENSAVLGVMVLETKDSGEAEIVGIAVSPRRRRLGIGRQMVQYAMELPGIRRLYAETDDDAAAFYRSCGFHINSHVETFPDGEAVRYQCILEK